MVGTIEAAVEKARRLAGDDAEQAEEAKDDAEVGDDAREPSPSRPA